MIERTHPDLIQAADDLVIRRYTNLSKFEKLLNEKSLFFCRLDKFGDSFEGATPKKEVVHRVHIQKEGALFYGCEISEEEAQKRADDMAEFHKQFRTKAIANCWMGTLHESTAMWELYAGKNGMAVQSRIHRLISSLNDNPEEILLSRVRYIDYETDIWYHSTEYPRINYNDLVPFVHKRLQYRHEEEVRLFHVIADSLHDENYWMNQPIENGKLFPVNINDLIEKIILSPTIESQFEDEIYKLIADNNLNCPVEKSVLSKEPTF